MRKLVLLSIAALFVNLSVQAHTVITKTNSNATSELYNSIYSDFENYYKNETVKETKEDQNNDELYNDLLESFENYYKQETAAQGFQDENNDNLYSDLSGSFNFYYTCTTIIEKCEDGINDQLYNSLYNNIEKSKSMLALSKAML